MKLFKNGRKKKKKEGRRWGEEKGNSIGIMIINENKYFFLFSSCNNTAGKHDMIKLEWLLCLLTCLITFAS